MPARGSIRDPVTAVRLLLVQAFTLPETSRHTRPPTDRSKQALLMNHADVAHLLADVQWDLHPGPLAPQGDSYVETREEFAIVGVDNAEADEVTVRADGKEFRARVRLDTPRERDYLRHGGILPYVLRKLAR